MPEVKTWPTLYKSSSKSKEQQWDITVVPAVIGEVSPGIVGIPADIIVRHGQVGGKIQESKVHIDKGKNLGKANETTPYQQACSEAASKFLKQKDKGYSEERGGGSMERKPMLAHKYEDCKDKVVFPAYIQPKLDGMRCIAHRETPTLVTLTSRLGKEFGHWLNHIRDALGKLMEVGETWDGELYVHGMPFQTLSSLVKKEQPDTKKIQYHVYDKVTDDVFADRSFAIALALDPEGTEAAEPWKPVDPCLVKVPTLSVKDHTEVEFYHEHFVSRGYEGAILRVGDCTYKQGYRSRELLKVKAWQDGEFRIVGVKAGIGKMANQGIFVCEMPDKSATFDVKPTGRDSLRETYLREKDKYIGKMYTVKYFSMTDSEKPVPRFPSGIAVRDYE